MVTRKEFIDVYWFTPVHQVKVVNPTSKDYPFKSEARNFIIRAGESKPFPGHVANAYLSQMSRILAQDEDKFDLFSDYSTQKEYYDRLIVDVENLAKEDKVEKPINEQLPPWQQQDVPTDTDETVRNLTDTVASLQNELAALKAQSAPQNVPEPAPEPVDDVKEKEREFDFEGIKYKMVVDKNDKAVYFKGGKRVSPAEYERVASML